MIPIVFSRDRYSRANPSTSVDFPAPGEPVNPTTRERPVAGNKALSNGCESAVRFSTAVMARAIARRFPARTSAAQVSMDVAIDVVTVCPENTPV
jgi:hypothetical protein